MFLVSDEKKNLVTKELIKKAIIPKALTKAPTSPASKSNKLVDDYKSAIK
jgi:hypothetical protein